MTKEPKLIFKDTDKIQKEIYSLDNTVNIINIIIDNFNELEVGDLKDISDLKRMVSSPKEFVIELVNASLPESADISGVKLSKTKLLGLAIPESLPAFVQLVNTQREALSTIDFDNLIFFEEGVSLKSNVKEIIEKKHSVYLDTPEKIQFYNMIHSFEKTWCELKEAVKSKAGLHINLKGNELFGERVDNEAFYISQKVLVNIIKNMK